MPEDAPRLPFEIDDVVDPSLVTGRAGVPLAIELFRQLGVAATIDAQVVVKQRQRGPPPSQLVETLIALWTSGGDRCQDLATLREDPALTALLGYALPAATTVRAFLDVFYVERLPLWQPGRQAAISQESVPLVGLGQANRTMVASLPQGAPATTATLDVDATLPESHKDAATVAYAGTLEHAHHVLKNELAAGALPRGKFGANAAWFRLNVLTHNLLTAFKRLPLPGDFQTARPKRLRFLPFNTVGKVCTTRGGRSYGSRAPSNSPSC